MTPGPVVRCDWARGELMQAYHDAEWGVPLHDDRALFELLILEGAQAGLSWSTILAKRDRYREVFAGFDPEVVAGFGPEEVAGALADPGIVRNRAKVNAAVGNAQAWLALRAEGSVDAHLWSFVDGRPQQPRRATSADVPAATPTSAALSADLRRWGFRFVGPTICYAYMQSAGMVNDHVVACYRHDEVAATRTSPAAH